MIDLFNRNKSKNKLPLDYTKLTPQQRREVRQQYVKEQKNVCHYCGEDLRKEPSKRVKEKSVDWKLFPSNFLQYPIHLQHNHRTGMTEGAVHSYCNAVMWQYEGR
jgi:hypothetical protein